MHLTSKRIPINLSNKASQFKAKIRVSNAKVSPDKDAFNNEWLEKQMESYPNEDLNDSKPYANQSLPLKDAISI